MVAGALKRFPLKDKCLSYLHTESVNIDRDEGCPYPGCTKTGDFSAL